MKTQDFSKKITSKQLQENIEKQFGKIVKLEGYTREQLEDIRNKFRTKLFQYENSAGFNDLLSNEAYQRDKAMLELINTRIKEMLGEDIKRLKEQLATISENKKSMKKPIRAKGTDQTGDGKSDFDDVQVARMTAGGVPKKQAIARATSDKFKEDRKVVGRAYGGSAQKDDDDNDQNDSGKKPSGSLSITSTDPGKYGDAHSRDARAQHKAATSKIPGRVIKGKAQSGSKEVDESYTINGKKVSKSAYDREMAKAGKKVKEASAKCNHTSEGKMCPVHGMKECGTMEAAERKAKVKPSKGMTATEKSAAVKQAKSGKDMGKPGKTFNEQAAGGGEKGKKIAGAAFWKGQAAKVKESNDIFRRHVSIVNESLNFLIQENEEEKAKAITAAGDIVNDYTSWMQRVGQYQTKAMVELADAIRADFGPAQAEAFKQAVGPALASTLETLMSQREVISNAVATLAGEQMPTTPMGPPEAAAEPVEPAAPDMMNEPSDEFTAADAAAGGPETAGREMRESKFARKLAESHSILSKLAR